MLFVVRPSRPPLGVLGVLGVLGALELAFGVRGLEAEREPGRDAGRDRARIVLLLPDMVISLCVELPKAGLEGFVVVVPFVEAPLVDVRVDLAVCGRRLARVPFELAAGFR